MNAHHPSHAVAGVDTLRLLTCGSVDDGKSTLIGRMLYDAGVIPDDQLQTLERDSRRMGTTGGDLDFALLVDGLEAERQQGITIDVAYRYFRTERRAFVIADTPGHEQFTRNMVTGASTADLAVLLVDARKGLLTQTRRHSRLCALLGIRRVVVAVNKLDLCDYSHTVFREVEEAYRAFAEGLGFEEIVVIPVAAVSGDNVASRSTRTPWYEGPALLPYLETVPAVPASAGTPFRLPVQWINRPNLDFRGIAGRVASGALSVGERVVVAGSNRRSAVRSFVSLDAPREHVAAGDAVLLTLEDEIDVARGDVLFKDGEAEPQVLDQFAANLVWMADEPLLPGRSYVLRLGTREVPATVTSLRYKLDVNTNEHLAARQLALNEIGFCHLSTSAPVAFDAYEANRELGGFILVDRTTNGTVGAGMIAHALRRAENVHAQALVVDRASRSRLKAHGPGILWFTGLSGAGKSTIANAVEGRLNARGVHTYLLDGDNLRLGLNRDLGFTDADRVENIRRFGEVAKLFVDAGLVVLCSLISPFRADRASVRQMVEPGEFFEIFVDTPLDLCIARDPKGLYRKALAGQIGNFTGLGSPYEPPEAPELRLDTAAQGPDELAAAVVRLLEERGILA